MNWTKIEDAKPEEMGTYWCVSRVAPQHPIACYYTLNLGCYIILGTLSPLNYITHVIKMELPELPTLIIDDSKAT